MPKKYRIHLTQEERCLLESLLRKDSSSAKQQRRARILLLCDEQREGGALTDGFIAEHTHSSVSSVERTRRDLAEQGLEVALGRARSGRRYRRKLDGAAEARLIAECCGPPPEGRVRWTLRLLADRMVELEVVESLSHESVRRVLQANLLKPWLKKQWCLPPQGQRRLRLRDGADPGGLSSAARSTPPPGLSG
jgi:hypothetical protein